jgi:phosphatidylglycerophosphate synthase
LARLQGSESNRGGLLDAVTDRMKEVMLYTGAAYALASSAHPQMAALAVAACGASLCVSYVKAKGEAIVASLSTKATSYSKLNHMFKDGLMTFELRMTLLVVGLFIGQLAIVLGIIAVLSTITALRRLVRVSRAIGNV